MPTKNHIKSFVFTVVLLFAFFIQCHAQKVEWIDAANAKINSHSTSASLGAYVFLNNDGRRVVFTDIGGDTPFVFHSLRIPIGDVNLFPIYDTTGSLVYLKAPPISIGNYQDEFSEVKKNYSFYNIGAYNHDPYATIFELDSNGSLIWKKRIVDTTTFGEYYSIYNMTKDDSENLYFLLDVYGTSDISILGKSFNNNTFHTCIVKADSAGNLKWIKSISSSDNNPVALFTDHYGNIYYHGSTPSSLDVELLDGKTYKTSYRLGEFIGKLNPDGSPVWQHFFDNDFLPYFPFAEEITPRWAADDSGNLYILAKTRGTASFGNLTIWGNNNYSYDLIKFDSSGKTVWGHQMPELTPRANEGVREQFDSGMNGTVKLDSKGNIYTTGIFNGRMAVGQDTVIAGKHQATLAVFVNKFDSTGVLQWNKVLNYNPSERPESWAIFNDIAPDNYGNVYFTGEFADSIHMDTFRLYFPSTIFGGSLNNFALLNGKLAYAPVYMPDSMGYSHICGTKPYYFHLYYHTTPDSVVWNFGDGTQGRRFNPVHVYATGGTYTVTTTAYIHGQIKILSQTVSYVIFPSNLLPRDTVLCPGTSLSLNCTVPGAISYLWNDGDTSPKRTLNIAGQYKITVYGSVCQQVTDSFMVSYDNRSFSLGHDTTLCQNNTITLTGPIWAKARYQWNTGNITQNQVVISSGPYSLIVYDSACHFSDTINVKYDLFPSGVIPSDTVICVGRPISFSIKGFTGSILWQDGKTDTDYNIAKAGTYSLTLKNQCGTRTYTTVITDSNCECNLYVPNSFSPNNDQHNDFFLPVSDCVPESYSLQIYNRWGEMIFQSNDINTGWNGSFKSVTVPSGVYIYKIIYKFQRSIEQEKVGTVEVM